jgi:hypothetical protein
MALVFGKRYLVFPVEVAARQPGIVLVGWGLPALRLSSQALNNCGVLDLLGTGIC